MISFDSFKTSGNQPIYIEILDYIKRGAVAGTICDGDELPSRRVLSALLGINPNTVQKAFRILEDEGLVSSRSGAKSFMTLSEDKIAELRSELLAEDIKGVIVKLRQAGISKEEAAELITRNWED